MIGRDRRLGRLELAEAARDDLRGRRIAALFAAGRLKLLDDGRIAPDDADNAALSRIADLLNLAAARRDRASRARG